MEGIKVHDTAALSEYYKEHVYDPSRAFEWIRLTDRVMEKSIILAIPLALVSIAINYAAEPMWNVRHWLKYKKKDGAFVRRWK